MEPPPQPRRIAWQLAALVGLLVGATALVALFERVVGVANADPVYLLAVVTAAVAFGTPAALVTAVASFLLYDFFFVSPVLTFTVAGRTAWLDLFLLLVVGAIVGQLAAMQRNRAEAAERRERDANAMYAVSREFDGADPVDAAIRVAPMLASATAMRSLWIALGPTPDRERVVASVGPDKPIMPRLHCLLRQGSLPDADWVTLHAPHATWGAPPPPGATVYRAVIDVGGESLGSIWGIRDREAPVPDAASTRILSLAADQLGRSIERTRLAERAASAEIARRSEALKTALLDSVSHDLRTPLASVRAAAGNLMDPDVAWSPEEQREIAGTIDAEAERLNELVSTLLDMSRIEAGELIPHPEPYALADLVREIVGRRRARLEPRRVEIRLDGAAPPVLVDSLFLEQALGNVLDNVGRHTPPSTTVTLTQERGAPPGRTRLVVEDDGPGVPGDALPRLFDKFYRVPRAAPRGRGGTGVGLSVARGLVEAMAGSITARDGATAGLAIVIELPEDVLDAVGPHGQASHEAAKVLASGDRGAAGEPMAEQPAESEERPADALTTAGRAASAR